MNDINLLKKMINESNKIVVFTGAGVSTLSGLKDFRSKDGLYNKKNKYDLPPEYMLSSDCFFNHTKEFYEYYKENLNSTIYKPNIIHKYLKKLEDSKKLIGVITQNIDGFDKEVGIKNVYEIHGTIKENYCLKCHKKYDEKIIFNNNELPICSCKGLIKPNVVLYGEELPQDILHEAIKKISICDMLIVLGTSLTVYPARNLITYFRGKYLVIINKDVTAYDYRADLVINDDLNNVFKHLT